MDWKNIWCLLENFWRYTFHPSCCIGFYAGDKFLNLGKKKKDVKK